MLLINIVVVDCIFFSVVIAVYGIVVSVVGVGAVVFVVSGVFDDLFGSVISWWGCCLWRCWLFVVSFVLTFVL